MIDEQTYNSKGYGKKGLKKEYIEEVHSRTRGPDGKVYRGEAGRQLLRRKMEVQKYYEHKYG